MITMILFYEYNLVATLIIVIINSFQQWKQVWTVIKFREANEMN